MWVNHLSLADFRNYSTAEFSLKKGANLFLGRNGQGKTNAIEAIAYFSTLGSHRVSSDGAMIASAANAATARMNITRLGRDVLLEVQINKAAPNRAQLNRSTIKPRELPQYFSCVVFAPEDLQIVRGDPAQRRKFLDEVLVLRNPGFASVIADYERVVKQRTTLLKSARTLKIRKSSDSGDPLTTIELWDAQLVTLGSKIIHAREQLILALEPHLREAYRAIVDDDHKPSLSLRSSIDTQEVSHVPRETRAIEMQFKSALAANFALERERAMTLAGPHRDELELSLNALPVKGYASHGETWSFVLALKLAVAQLSKAENPAGDPVLILDDVFAELDLRRRNNLFRAIQDFDQVIVTAAVADDVPTSVDWNIIQVEAGQVVNVGTGQS